MSFNKNQDKINKRILNDIKELTGLIEQDLKNALDKVRVQMVKLYEKYSVKGKLTNAEMTKYNRLQSMEKELIKQIGPDYTKAKSQMKRLTDIQYDRTFFQYAWAVDQEARVTLSWGSPYDLKEVLSVKEIKDFVRADSLNRFKEQGIRRIKQTIVSGINQGLTIKEMMKNIRGAFGISRNEAERIIRTETNRLANLGKNAEYRKALSLGIDTVLKLVSVLDTRTRAQSAQMDSQLSNERGEFKYPDGLFHIPGSTGVAKWDINDRETTVQIIEDYSPQLRRAREEGVFEFKDFKTWAKDKGLKKNIYGQKLGV